MSKLFLLNSDSGFTLIELMVSSTLGMMVVGLVIGIATSNRNLYQHDLVRTSLNQNLRGAMEIIEANGREAGENLSDKFEAIVLTDGGTGVSDELTLRRNLVGEVLKVCQAIVAGSSVNTITFADASTTAGCAHTDNVFSYSTWQSYRVSEGGLVRAYIYNQATREGEFFEYDSEVDTGTELYIHRTGGSWQYDYPVASSAVYLLEEWHFSLVTIAGGDKVLEVIENDDSSNPLNVVYGLTDFQVKAIMEDGTIKDELLATDSWIDLRSIEVSIAGSDMWRDKVIDKTLTGRFFPRNILSN